LLRSALVLSLTAVLLVAGTSAFAEDSPGSQVVVEAGMIVPYGQLGADFGKTRLGFGASEGLEIGFNYRIFLSQAVSIAPSFLFLDYGNYNGVDDEIGDFRVQSSSYHFTLGAGLFRNRVTGFYQDNTKAMDRSINTMGYSLRAGIQLIGLEFSVVYNINRFNTWQFYQSDYRERYNWDSISFRAGWLIPFAD